MKQYIAKKFAAGLLLVGMVSMVGGIEGATALAAGSAHNAHNAPNASDAPAASQTKELRTLPHRLSTPVTAALVPVLVAVQPGQVAAVTGQIKAAGGYVSKAMDDVHFLIAWLPGRAVDQLEESPQVVALGLDRQFQLDFREMEAPPETRVAQADKDDITDPGASLAITTGEIGAAQFRAESGQDGTGITIAVLDTGVDPGHPDLQTTPDGRPKLIDWQDFSGEGDIELDGERRQPIPGIVSLSGVYKTGVVRETDIAGGQLQGDINRNGATGDEFAVLVADTAAAGLYDTAWIDLDGDGDFTNEKPMQEFRVGQEWNTFGETAPRADQPEIIDGVNFAVTRIAPDGTSITLGFDGALHGTHVAGIAAASGRTVGVAPGAQIIAVKVLTSAGTGSWAGIIEGMQYAASRGAKVINMSLGGDAAENDGADPQSLLIDGLTEKYGVLFSIAAGNSGPGLNTMGVPGVAREAITSGAYVSPATYQADYGLDVAKEGLWYFSSTGPRADGILKPNVIAPGAARSATPPWAGMYQLFQGTSMAAPQTTGAAALLYGAALAKGINVHPRQVRLALQDGARRLPDYGWAEQGYGLIQVDAAWQKLQALSAGLTVPVRGRSHFDRNGDNVYRHRMYIENGGIFDLPIELQYAAGAGDLKVQGPRAITVPAGTSRPVDLTMSGIYYSDYYDALVTGRMALFNSPVLEYLVTVVHPLRLGWDNTVRNIEGCLDAARYARYFVKVPTGTGELEAILKVPTADGKLQGRVRMLAYSPEGMLAGETDYAGAPDGPGEISLTLNRPQAGTWELVVYASHGAALYDVSKSLFTLDLVARGVYSNPPVLNIDWQPHTPGITRGVSLLNLYGAVNAAATGSALVPPTLTRYEIKTGEVQDHFFTVNEGTALARFALADTAAAVELDLATYYNDPQKGWVQVGRGPVTELPGPAPGEYAVEITARAVPGGKAPYTLATVHVGAGTDIWVQDAMRPRRPGTAWQVSARVQMPPGPGEYYGAIIVKDEADKMLQVVPVTVKPSLP